MAKEVCRLPGKPSAWSLREAWLAAFSTSLEALYPKNSNISLFNSSVWRSRVLRLASGVPSLCLSATWRFAKAPVCKQDRI